ncbi:PREDICTED: LOB domain-containing protein 25-like [Tarenaya hassleriana]|uniref:LOB domain-containing protein 25-like n=1 Tax=Tarenaya hassleriana TaxID=28532 RepID=UPI00053C7C0C|nr:PREDICTED: LOB domain-containing protein 25-like [Tarenaya hassleriana]
MKRKREQCAACKYQHRRCTSDCILPPYFPEDEPETFKMARNLFGVSNIKKMIRDVAPHLREDAVRSIKYEALFRSMFPVHGCCLVINELSYQIIEATKQLSLIQAQVEARFQGEPSDDGRPFP